MQYVILDLEWNNAYGRKIGGFINEIIEIGAVKLDEELNEIESYREFVGVQIGKKLNGRVKELTHISNEDLTEAHQFTKVMSEFRKWIGKNDTVILTWGQTDIRVLIDNFKYFNGIDFVPFLKSYVDLQQYVQEKLGVEKGSQIGLLAASQELHIEFEECYLHRALFDSRLSAECLKKTFNEEVFSGYIRACDKEFYERLFFKSYFISDINNPLIDKSQMFCQCKGCGRHIKRASLWEYKNQSFRAFFYCSSCDKKYRLSLRFKKYYDHLDIKRKVDEYIEPNNDQDQQESIAE